MRPLFIFFWPARGCMQKINKIKEKHSWMQTRFLCVAGDTSQYQYPTIRNWHHLFRQCLAQPIRVSLAFLIWMPSEQGHVAPWPMRSCIRVSGWAKIGKQGSAIFLTDSLAQNVSYAQKFCFVMIQTTLFNYKHVSKICENKIFYNDTIKNEEEEECVRQVYSM